jgi:hypothetical protein
MPDEEEGISLLRYFLWADCLRNSFEKALRQTGCVDISSSEGFNVAMYMSLWYGCLYAVIEGWYALSLKEREIDSLLTSPHVSLLRRYRNATFHYQKKYMHEKFTDFIYEGESSAVWVRAVHDAFADYISTQYGELPKW